MPIYAYRCETCGHAKDVLQKISDPVLTVCPDCGASTFRKQLTAAGFQLKGSGWYVTDFKGGKAAGKPSEGAEKAEGKGASDAAPATPGDASKAESTPAPAGAAKGDSAPGPASAPAPASSPPSGAASGSGTGPAGGRQP